MKIHQILILGLLFTFVSSTCSSTSMNFKSLDECGKLSQEEKDNGKTHCCFAKKGDIGVCVAYSDSEYDVYKDSQGSTVLDGESYTYKCYLPYLKFGFLNIIFFSLFIL